MAVTVPLPKPFPFESEPMYRRKHAREHGESRDSLEQIGRLSGRLSAYDEPVFMGEAINNYDDDPNLIRDLEDDEIIDAEYAVYDEKC